MESYDIRVCEVDEDILKKLVNFMSAYQLSIDDLDVYCAALTVQPMGFFTLD